MLKCPECGRAGGPFRLRHQVQADGQMLRSWACPCGVLFHATAGAERTAGPQGPYSGFALEWNGRAVHVRLQRIGRHEALWSLGPWTVTVIGPPSGPGTRVVSISAGEEPPVAEWRLEPSWGPAEITRRTRGMAPADLDPELLARVFVRLLN